MDSGTREFRRELSGALFQLNGIPVGIPEKNIKIY
jgi:hypothetical protein